MCYLKDNCNVLMLRLVKRRTRYACYSLYDYYGTACAHCAGRACYISKLMTFCRFCDTVVHSSEWHCAALFAILLEL